MCQLAKRCTNCTIASLDIETRRYRQKKGEIRGSNPCTKWICVISVEKNEERSRMISSDIGSESVSRSNRKKITVKIDEMEVFGRAKSRDKRRCPSSLLNPTIGSRAQGALFI